MLNMKNFKTNIFRLALAFSIFPFTPITHAQTAVQPDIQRIEDIYALIEKVALWFQAFFFIIAAIFIILAAFSYLTSGGEKEKLAEAKNRLIYAVIAIVVAMLAFVLKTVVRNFLGTGTGIVL